MDAARRDAVDFDAETREQEIEGIERSSLFLSSHIILISRYLLLLSANAAKAAKAN